MAITLSEDKAGQGTQEQKASAKNTKAPAIGSRLDKALDKDMKFMTDNPEYDRAKPYQLVGWGQPKVIKSGKDKGVSRRKAIHHASFTEKRLAIRIARNIVKMPSYSQIEVFGKDNTLVYQCHWDGKKVVVEEL